MATVSGTNGNDLINASFLPQGTTDGNDSIYAFGGDDRVVRSLGNDVIDGGEGYDVLDFSGTSNRVVINIPSGWLRELSGITLVKADRFTNFEEFRTGGGDDVIVGGGGDDFIRPGLGRDTINGGAGFDTLLYTDAAIRVFVDLVRGFAIDHGGNRDGFDSIESARGGSGNDVLRGGFDFLFLRGNRGSDTIISGYDGVGNTVGGSGIDHSADVAGVTVDLLGGFAIDGWGDRDTLIGNFFAVRGSAFNDVLKGSNFNNAFRPGAGSDLIDGREGFDRVDMRDSGFGDPDGDGFVVTGTLNADFTGTVTDGSGGTDTLISIEHLRGSSFRDKLSAAGQAFVTFGAYGFASDWEGAWTHQIEGWAGNDVLIGAAGRAVIARYATDQGAISSTSPAASPSIPGATSTR